MRIVYAAFLPTALCNLYGYTGRDCTGQEVLIDNRICNNCIGIPPQPRIVSYRGIDMIGFGLSSRQGCRNKNLGFWKAGQCAPDPNALAASAYIEC
ncbi:hypothetical protein MY11210_004256 [Beauveria gryllotalpidicola]